MTEPIHTPRKHTRKRQHNVKAADAQCLVCRGLRYKIPQRYCAGCNRMRDAKWCPACGGMPERVAGQPGTPCGECGTPAGKNLEYEYSPKGRSSVAWDH